MAVSAVDIITYIGIPLAVLGVLPTIYTCLKSFFTLREITHTLHRNGVTAITRSALLSGIVEIEIPRRSITPLDRSDPAYFEFRDGHSTLKGGTWTMFCWKEMVIGVKSYRLQYHDELAQPQAEVEFEALVAFLLDRGAVPSKEGWADLRSAGLWTPAGTRLLVGPGGTGAEEVLSVALSDDSDGILSLGLNWKREWGGRGVESLAPYWARVHPPVKEEDVLAKLEEIEVSKMEETKENEVDAKGGFLDDDSADGEVGKASVVRVKISAAGIQEGYREEDVKRKLPLFHLRSAPSFADSTAGFWFCCGATAFEASRGGLWAFSIPDDVVSVARRETVPCGVMVLLGAMTDEEVPTWRTPYDHQAEQFERHVKFTEQSRRVNEEMRLPPDQREAARRKRLETEAADFHNEFRRKMIRDKQRREAEMLEAMQSQKLPISTIAEANRKWLVQKFELPESVTPRILLEQILFGMVQNSSFAKRLAAILDLWKNWSQSGGMTKGHYAAVQEDQVVFALASFVLLAIRSTVNEPTGSVIGDLQECLRLWKKVRLG